jgi:hypothetical protein
VCSPPNRLASLADRCDRPGQKVIKPKKASLITQNKIKKKSAAGLVGTTEKFLAEKAGHLEILRGGKKDKKEGAKAK